MMPAHAEGLVCRSGPGPGGGAWWTQPLGRAMALGGNGLPHYFAPDPLAPSHRRVLTARIRGRDWRFVTDTQMFSARELDAGTMLLAQRMEMAPADRVLDLGAGYGVLGLVAASLAPAGQTVLVEANPRAGALCEENRRLNGVQNATVRIGDGLGAVVGEKFDLIVTNPPIRAGKRVYYPWFRGAPAVLAPQGRLLVVIRVKQGAASLTRELAGTFSAVETLARSGGYHVIGARGVRA